MNENPMTKREVVMDLLGNLSVAYDDLFYIDNDDTDLSELSFLLGKESRKKYLAYYDEALPDNLPTLPQSVVTYTKDLWKYHRDLVDVLGLVRDLGVTRTQPTEALLWVSRNVNDFALAWVLGVCIVKETGRVVKL